MRLYVRSEALYVCCERRGVLRVDRRRAALQLLDENEGKRVAASFTDDGETIRAVLGVLELPERPDADDPTAKKYWLLVVTHSTVVGHFFVPKKCDIQRIDRVRAVELDSDIVHLDIPLPSQPQIASMTMQNDLETGGKKRFLDGLAAKLTTLSASVPSSSSSSTSPEASYPLLGEILRLFNDQADFYFCDERDMTQSTQRLLGSVPARDDRFFWNRWLLTDIVNQLPSARAQSWLVPVIQGFVAQRPVSFASESAQLVLTLIARRSVHRAGCRYLRRGVDKHGYVANFVESELILSVLGHNVSFVQIRGSVPIFWRQSGIHYRPPLLIHGDKAANAAAFQKHITDTVGCYGGPPLACISLIGQHGREAGLARAYVEHALALNSPDLEFYAFDFHAKCRGIRMDKVDDELLAALQPTLQRLGCCWVDKNGQMVASQTGVVRTNCVDCLDRTNVVQCAISQNVAFRHAARLGLVSPDFDAQPWDENGAGAALRHALKQLWADHGDAISRQYAGTDALKGDLTRSGERKLVGIVKDGYSSASRYYLSHVRDRHRQSAIDALLRAELDEEEEQQRQRNLDEQNPEGDDDDDDDQEENESVGRLIAETAMFLLPDQEVLVGGWALVDEATATASGVEHSVDSVLLLTRVALYTATYDGTLEKPLDLRIVDLADVKEIETGKGKHGKPLLGIVSPDGRQRWRAARTRLFNNVPIRLRSDAEAEEYLNSVADQIRAAVEKATGRDPGVRRVAQPSKQREMMSNLSSALKKGVGAARRKAGDGNGGKPPSTAVFYTVENGGGSKSSAEAEDGEEIVVVEREDVTGPSSSSSPPTNNNSVMARLQAKWKDAKGNPTGTSKSTAYADLSEQVQQSRAKVVLF